MMLSAHFSLEELTASEVAARAGIDNTPSAEVVRNFGRLAEGLELVRSPQLCPARKTMAADQKLRLSPTLLHLAPPVP